MNYNKVILIGRLGNDPELKEKIGDRFMKHYNYYLNELGHSPSAAFEAAEGAIYLLDYYKK